MAKSVSLDFIEATMVLFQKQSDTIIERLQPTCINVIFSLMVIDLIIDLLFDQGEENIFLILLRKVMLYGLFLTIILQYKVIINDYILKGFIQLGNYLSIGKMETSFVLSPTKILANYFDWTIPFWSVSSLLMMTVDKFGIESIPTGLCLLILATLGIYVSLTCTVIMTFIRFFVVSSCALIIVPFGVLKETSSIGRDILTLLLKQGVKIMFMVMILNLMGNQIKFEGKIGFTSLSVTFLQGAIWFFLVKEIPMIAEEVFGGHLGGGGLAGSGIMKFGAKEVAHSFAKNGGGGGISPSQAVGLSARSLHSKFSRKK